MRPIRDMDKKYTVLLFGLLPTFVLLVIFAVIQQFLPSALALDVRWIAVAVLPLVVALIFEGYVKKIKGFGIELEMRMEEPVVSLDLKATEAFTPSPAMAKQDRRAVESLDTERKREIARLRFISGRREYYKSDAILDYIRQLPNLEYFEVIRPNETFICLVPISLFGEREHISQHELSDFVNALERNRIKDFYSHHIITLSVKLEQSIIEVLQTMRNQVTAVAVVLDSKGWALGVIKTSDIEKRISDEVLLEIKRKKKG